VTPTPSTPAQAVPDATRLTNAGCAGPAPSSAAKPLGRYFTIRPSPEWTESPALQHTETLLLELHAPNVYDFAPTFIQFHSLIGPVHTVYGSGATAHSIAQAHAEAVAQEWSPDAIAGTVTDCHLGGEEAAAFGMSGDLITSSGTTSGQFIRVYAVHNDLL